MEWILAVILCVLAGVTLLIVEVFMPGFGVPGISGIVLLLGGIATAWVQFSPTTALIILAAVTALLAIAISLSLRLVSSGKLKREGLTLQDSNTDPDKQEALREMQLFVGKIGTVRTALRPVGEAEFDCGKLSVISEDGYIEKSEAVRIIRVEGTTIYVDKVTH